MSAFNLVQGPASEPITLADAKLNLRVDLADDDALITDAIAMARERCELETGLQLITATWEIWLDHFPGLGHTSRDDGAATGWGGAWNGWMGASAWLDWSLRANHRFIDMPFAPLQQVVSIKYVDTSGVLQTWDPSQYQVSAPMAPRPTRGRIQPAYGVSWPATLDQMRAVIVQFKAGFGDAPAAIPRLLRRAMLLTLGDIYEYRQDTNSLPGSSGLLSLPNGVQAIFSQHRARPVMKAAA